MRNYTFIIKGKELQATVRKVGEISGLSSKGIVVLMKNKNQNQYLRHIFDDDCDICRGVVQTTMQKLLMNKVMSKTMKKMLYVYGSFSYP